MLYEGFCVTFGSSVSFPHSRVCLRRTVYNYLDRLQYYLLGKGPARPGLGKTMKNIHNNKVQPFSSFLFLRIFWWPRWAVSFDPSNLRCCGTCKWFWKCSLEEEYGAEILSILGNRALFERQLFREGKITFLTVHGRGEGFIFTVNLSNLLSKLRFLNRVPQIVPFSVRFVKHLLRSLWLNFSETPIFTAVAIPNYEYIWFKHFNFEFFWLCRALFLQKIY